MNHFTLVRHQGFAHDLVFAIERDLSSLTRYFKNVAILRAYIWLAW